MRSRRDIEVGGRHYLWIVLVVLLGMSGCTSVKSFMARDLEDEDFIITQLYADELVKETPVISKPVAKKQNGTKKSNALGLDYNKNDNANLYNAVNSWIGVPYRYGGNDRKGIDCSAFVGQIYKSVYGKTLRRTTSELVREAKMISKSQLKEGDLVFFTNSKGKVAHVGIYLKENLFAHSSTSQGVCVSSLTDTYWSKHFYKGGRFL